jgi:dolichyl-phosphate beta-glucosyltransferase
MSPCLKRSENARISTSFMIKIINNNFFTFFKYSVVGVSGTIVDLGTLYIFVDFLHIPVLLATAISFILAVINNFILNKYWTFQNKSSNVRKQFIKFLIVSVIGLLLTEMFMALFVYVLKIWYLISKLLTSAIILVWNFLGNKHWTFKDKHVKPVYLENYPYDLSIIVPAYNEEHRVASTLKGIDRFFSGTSLRREIIVVDDGSKDETVSVINQLAKDIADLSVVEYGNNMGKGYAVKQGVEHSKGKYILFTDADNSTPIEEVEKLLPHLEVHEIVIGSRYISGSDIKIKQPAYRVMLGRLGNALIQFFLLDGIKDTQCGFKIFRHNAAKEIFSRMKINRWGFDMEVLVIARLLAYSIKEIPVSWYNSPESRVRPLRDAVNTLKELVIIKLNLWGGRYNR